jgi:hypothetical protein
MMGFLDSAISKGSQKHGMTPRSHEVNLQKEKKSLHGISRIRGNSQMKGN